MKVIPNNIIPIKGFQFCNVCGLLFVRREAMDRVEKIDYNHEAIHTAQMKELLYVFFYIIYFFEWLYRLVFHTKTAYMGISFEREAYENEDNLDYLKTRKHFAQWRKQ